MKLSTHSKTQLYIAVAASTHAAIVNKGRSRPQMAAHLAREHALAAVREISLGSRNRKGDRK